MINKPSLMAIVVVFVIASSGCDGGISAEGKILDQYGNPVKGAKVVLVSRGARDERISRDDGSYDVGVIHAPVSPSGTLTVSKEGYQTFEQSFRSRQELGHHFDI